MKHYSSLLPGEHERLAILSEEMGEAIQAIGKIMRHGYDGTDDNGVTNRQQLSIELADVEWAVMRLREWNDISILEYESRIAQRIGRNNYLHHGNEP